MSLGVSTIGGAPIGSMGIGVAPAPIYAERIIHQGTDMLLFRPSPNWESVVEITHRLGDYTERGRTGRENRTPLFASVRHEITATWTLTQDEAYEIDRQLWTLGEAYVAIPFPIDQLTPDTWGQRIYEAEYALNYDASGWAIVSGGSIPESPDYAYLAPLFVGRMERRPTMRALSHERCTVSISLIERSPWDYRIAPVFAAVGANWPASILANWTQRPEIGTDDILEFVDLGDGRVQAIDGQEGATSRRQRIRVTMLDRSEVRALLNFFVARKGRVESFVVPWEFRPSPGDYAATPHATRVRFASDGLRIRYINGNVGEAQVDFVQLPWELQTLAGETPVQASEAYLYRFVLACPNDPVTWRYTSWETELVVSGEGTFRPYPIQHDKITTTVDLSDDPVSIASWIVDSSNPLLRIVQRAMDYPLRVYIYRCDPLAPSLSNLLYEGEVGSVGNSGRQLDASTVILGGMLDTKVPSWLRQPTCQHSFCGRGCFLDIEKWTIAAVVMSKSGNDVTVLMSEKPPITRLCDVAEGTNHIGLPGFDFRSIYPGVRVSGPHIPADSVIVSTNEVATESFFTIDKTPTSGSWPGESVELTFTEPTPDASGAIGNDWFARGSIAGGAGLGSEIRQVIRSVDLGSGQHRLSLRRPFRSLGVGDLVTLRADCTGTREECENKFNNYINFGGAPHMGKNLSVPSRSVNPGGGKK